MNGKQLKNSILQWAIQGKLVPQDPNDEPASVLLDKIRQEKERLIKEKKIKRDKNASIIYRGEDNSYYEKILATGEVKCIDEEVPFEIPQGWEWCRLRDIIIFIGGYAYDSHSFLEKSEYQVLRLGNIKNDTINKSVNPVFIDEILAQDTVRFRCLKNDILVTMTGTKKKRDYFYTVLIDTDHSNMYFNQRVGCLRAIYSPIALWLNKVLKAETILHQVFQYETGTANQGNLGASNIMNTLIPLPPVTEQFRIVKKLEEVHTYVFQYDKAQCELDILNFGIRNTIKKSLVQEAIQGKLVPQITEEGTAQELLEQIKEEKLKLVKEGKLKKSALNDSVIFRGDDKKYWEKKENNVVCIDDEIPFEIPNSWNWCRLKDIGRTETGTTPSKLHPEYFGNYIPFLSPANILGSKIISETQGLSSIGIEFGRVVPKNSILQVCIGGSIGKCTIVNKPATFNQQINSITPYLCNVEFVHIVLQSEYFRLAIMDKATGTATPIINRGNWETLLFPLPPLKEQLRIIEKYKGVTSIMSR
ncbi:restriction endonuclease subunit S [Prevotella merdae]|uniref:restriction endonuclease subunit S n=1 Tax=Prevotella merdae TaxID=2079531 RepID=UPI003566C49E